MKLNLDVELVAFNGQKIKSDGDKYATLKEALLRAATIVLEDDVKLNGQQKFELFQIAQNLSKGGVIELKAEDVTLLKERVAKAYDSMLVGPVYVAIENNEKAES